MTIITKTLSFQTKGENDILDITDDIIETVNTTKLDNGIVTIFVPGSTGALTTIEYEPGLLIDLPNILEKIAPKSLLYEHEKRWHDGNGHSHVRAALIGPSLTVPFVDGTLTLGTWQQIVFLELDARSRRRKLIVQIIAE
ncbi:MAG: secondary thiamine-phosphate synthase enzyme YjbQ [Candidatus Bathyarchaeota archaeon]|nr:secondary thiamine-phosphate synthase enzyme YjbQ [Candidatus Bathyarchaeota archaeon]